MQINIQPNACVLTLCSDSLHARSVENFINKNFKRVLAFTNTRLVFTNKTESFKRAYFLQWAYQVYCKTHISSTLIEEKLKNIQNVPIKIIFISKKTVAQKLRIYIEVLEDKKLMLKSEEKNKQLTLYLKMRFQKVFVGVVSGNRGIYIDVKDKETLRRLKNLFSCSFIMGLPTEFIFPNGDIDNIAVDTEENSMVQDAYSILQVQPDASMKEVKAKYRKLVKLYHPDRVFMCDANMISKYTEKFQCIQDAFELIKQKSA